MIDVLKRLAELDSQNPNIIKESAQVDECGVGMMPEMGLPMTPPTPAHPASINMTAGSGEELGDLLTTIMSLAGVAKGGEEPTGAGPQGEPNNPVGMLEPATGGDEGGQNNMSPADSMRSVIDKLNPLDGEEDGEEGGEELGPFQGNKDSEGDDEEGDDDGMSVAQGDVDDDGDHDSDDHAAEKEKEEVDEYDNTPADPNKKNAFKPNQYAHQENQPGQGDRMDGTSPKAYADVSEAVNDLFAQYKKFVSEN